MIHMYTSTRKLCRRAHSRVNGAGRVTTASNFIDFKCANDNHLVQSTLLANAVRVLLRGPIVNRTYGIHKKSIYLTIFTNNILSYQVLTMVPRSININMNSTSYGD